MEGCCLFALIALLGPRVFLIVIWILTNWYDAFDSRLVALLGWFFLPYTSLAWMYIYFNSAGHQIQGGYLLLLIIGVLADIGVFSGGGRAMKRKW
jgi:hypothetical protein